MRTKDKAYHYYKPSPEVRKEVPVVHHCGSCQHFVWGLITPFYDTDGSCGLTNYAKCHNRDGCQHWEMK